VNFYGYLLRLQGFSIFNIGENLYTYGDLVRTVFDILLLVCVTLYVLVEVRQIVKCGLGDERFVFGYSDTRVDAQIALLLAELLQLPRLDPYRSAYHSLCIQVQNNLLPRECEVQKCRSFCRFAAGCGDRRGTI
jgi:hypothetical protein